jgi:sulfate/thiosulfate transport system ATP-binding protein
MRVELIGIAKRFGATAVLAPIDLDVQAGELLALLGPSGSGKTTLLRVIAGLERPSAGRILLDGRDASAFAPAARRIGFVFQHYALFRHMTVFENVAFGLRVRRRGGRHGEGEIRRRVGDLLGLVRLDDLAHRFPGEISGGQRQRVALARALAVEPKLLLLDEPFGALDAAVRHELRTWLGELHRRLGLTTVFVTHDQAEAFELGDRIAVLNRGRIEQIGSAAEIYDRPASPFVMEFLGRPNRIACDVRSGHIRAPAGWDFSGVEAEIPDGPATAYIRPEDVMVRSSAERGGGATVLQVVILGSRSRLVVEAGGETVEAEIARHEVPAGLTGGASVRVHFRRYRIFAAGSWSPASGLAPARKPVAVLS